MAYCLIRYVCEVIVPHITKFYYMIHLIKQFDDVIAGVNVKTRFYFDEETEIFSFQTNPQLKDKSQMKFHDFGGGTSIDNDYKHLKFKYYNTYKKEFSDIDKIRNNPNF